MFHEPQNPSDVNPLLDEPAPAHEHQDHRPIERTLFDPHPYETPTVAIEHDPMDAHQEFHDPVHGFVNYTRREVHIIDHPAFQRLFKVYQLGQTHLVFRGATHSRGQHSLGAVAAVELLMEATDRTNDRHKYVPDQKNGIEPRWKPDRLLDSTERAFARLAALLHDIGHVVDGHTIEDELGLLHDHGSRQRLEVILRRRNWRKPPVSTAQPISDIDQSQATHEDVANGSDTLTNTKFTSPSLDGSTSDTELLSQLINHLYAPFAKKANVWGYVRNSGAEQRHEDTGDAEPRQLTASEILVEIIVKNSDRSKLDENRSAREGGTFRVPVLRDLVGNTVCADLIDYLQRDWRHIGKPRHLDTRLLQYMEIVTDDAQSKLVVNLLSNHDRRPRPDVMSAILELLENRYHLWEVALLHRTKTCASAMLERAIIERAHEAGVINELRSRIVKIEDEKRQSAEVERAIFSEIEEVLLAAILDLSDPGGIPRSLGRTVAGRDVQRFIKERSGRIAPC